MRKIDYIFRIILNVFRFLALKLIYRFRIKCGWKLLVSLRADIYINNGGTIYLGNMCNIEKNTQIRSSGGIINIGNNVYINRNCNIVSHDEIVIEDNVTIGPNVCIFDHDHNYRKHKLESNYISKKVVIGHDTWIGSNCILTKGVTIGSNCVIAAGTVITKDVPDDMIVRSRFEYVTKKIGDY